MYTSVDTCFGLGLCHLWNRWILRCFNIAPWGTQAWAECTGLCLRDTLGFPPQESHEDQLKGKASHVNVVSLARACCPALTGFPVTSFGLGARTYLYIRPWRNLFSSHRTHGTVKTSDSARAQPPRGCTQKGGLKEGERRWKCHRDT